MIGEYQFNVKMIYLRNFKRVKNEKIIVNRRELFTDFELPMGENYNQFVSQLIDSNENN